MHRYARRLIHPAILVLAIPAGSGMRLRRVLYVGWALCAACGSGGGSDRSTDAGAAPDSSGSGVSGAEVRADTAAADPAAGLEAGLDAIRSRLPATALVREGACPFECCTYREWTATSPIPLFAAERDRSQVVDTIPAGARFRALGGNVHVTGLELVILTDTLRTWTSAVDGSTSPPGERQFLPGDTLVVLDYVGEGFYNIWYDGEVRQVEWFWWERQDGSSPARVVGEHETEWWVRAETEDGAVGWIPMDEIAGVRGADACS
jgi:hypothetical protein